jgi:hypothetical protein
VRTVEGRVEIDPSGKRNGRGAYLCHNPACWEQALKRHALERALRLPTVTPEDWALLTAFAQTLEHAIETEDEPAATQQ